MNGPTEYEQVGYKDIRGLWFSIELRWYRDIVVLRYFSKGVLFL